jgi:hypothetical protein
MAKQFIVKTTVQSRDGKGKKILLKSGSVPQEVPSNLVKELLARGAIEEVAAGTKEGSRSAAGAADEDAGEAGGAGDENAGE